MELLREGVLREEAEMKLFFRHPCPFCRRTTVQYRQPGGKIWCGECKREYPFPPSRDAARELWEAVEGPKASP